jgi:hypothetical protein
MTLPTTTPDQLAALKVRLKFALCGLLILGALLAGGYLTVPAFQAIATAAFNALGGM